MAFPPEFLDELRQRLSLPEIVGRRTKLVRRGREHSGLCPFHKEKTPSFTVSEDKGFYHCFGCGAHGDVIGFVMRTEGLSFPETVEKLAAEAGLPVPQSSPEERQRARQAATLHDAMERAAKWYEAQLASGSGRRARDYLAGRGLKDETVARFRLGFAPDAHAALKTALLKENIPEALLVEAGLIAQPEDGGRESYDRFRDRVMFPITDPRGRVIAFGGRALGEARAKYLNSPDTPLFHKGRVLFGLAQAREAARTKGRVLVVEGYMDAIALAEAGFAETVAPLGTALTEEQIGLLWKLAPEPVLLFDGDVAGQRAALRAAMRALPLLKPGHSLRFATVPQGEDPDTLVRRHGPGAIARLIEEAMPLVDVIWRAETEARLFDTPERRAGLRRRLNEIAAEIADRDVQEAYRREYAERMFRAFGFRGERGGYRARDRNARRAGPPPVSEGDATRVRLDARQLREKVALLALIRHPHLVEDFDQIFGRETFASEELETLRRDLIMTFLSFLEIGSVELERRLAESGHGPLIEHLKSQSIRVHAGFARPDASLEEARIGLREVWKAHYRDMIQDDHDRAVRAFMDNPCDQTMKSLETLRKAMQAIKEEQDLAIISSYMRWDEAPARA